VNARHTLIRTLSLALALTAAGALAASPAGAWYPGGTNLWANGQLVDVQVRVAGRAAPLFVSPEGDSRRYLQAFAGRNYSLVVRNDTGERIGVLIAVDGLNVVNGQRSNLQPGEAMYVLSPYETATIDGWRTSLDDIQRFVFVDEARSYAARTGQANGDMGWIRVNAFREQRASWLPYGQRWFDDKRDFRGENEPRRILGGGNAQGAPMADNAAPEAERKAAPRDEAPAPSAPMAKSRAMDRLQAEESGRHDEGSFPGTGWGQHQDDHVERVAFTAERAAMDQLVFRYEYASGLRALGIFPDRDRLRERDSGQLGFAKPPMW
jgi:hypothetical protein